MACDYSIHRVNGKLLDQFFFTSVDSTFKVTHEILQVYQTPHYLKRTRCSMFLTVNATHHSILSADLQDYGTITFSLTSQKKKCFFTWKNVGHKLNQIITGLC